jgi:hypothetical protein
MHYKTGRLGKQELYYYQIWFEHIISTVFDNSGLHVTTSFSLKCCFLAPILVEFGQKLNKDTETENIQKYFKQANTNVIAKY